MFSLPEGMTSATLVETVHPAVTAHRVRWGICLDAYDGEGGFLTGAYLWMFARELSTEFTARQAQARYHNYAAALVDYYVRKVYGRAVTRTSTNADLTAWWANVDGAGTDMTSYLRLALAKALSAGHVGILADKTRDQATGPAQSDEHASVFLTRYLPTALLDWRVTHDEQLVAVKLLEDVPSEDLLSASPSVQQVLLWDRDEWVRVPPGDRPIIERQRTGLGRVPLVVLRPFRHARWQVIGRALLGDGGILTALYNRASEQDEVLRNQSFSVFVVGLPATGEIDVEKAKAALGNEVGSLRALFTYGSGDYKTPAMDVPRTLESHQAFLVRELYRMAHIPYERDSREAQSGEAIRLQHEELTAVLAGVADECQRVEVELCKLWCAWMSATADAGAALFEAAAVAIQYPETFFEVDPAAELETLAAAIQAVPSPTFEKAMQKAIVATVSGSLDEATIEAIHAEIEAGDAQKAQDVTTLRRGARARLAAATVDDEDEPAETAA